MQTTVIATLEGERAALERDRDTLRSSMDALRTAQRKVRDSTCTENTDVCYMKEGSVIIGKQKIQLDNKYQAAPLVHFQHYPQSVFESSQVINTLYTVPSGPFPSFFGHGDILEIRCKYGVK